MERYLHSRFTRLDHLGTYHRDTPHVCHLATAFHLGVNALICIKDNP